MSKEIKIKVENLVNKNEFKKIENKLTNKIDKSQYGFCNLITNNNEIQNLQKNNNVLILNEPFFKNEITKGTKTEHCNNSSLMEIKNNISPIDFISEKLNKNLPKTAVEAINNVDIRLSKVNNWEKRIEKIENEWKKNKIINKNFEKPILVNGLKDKVPNVFFEIIELLEKDYRLIIFSSKSLNLNIYKKENKFELEIITKIEEICGDTSLISFVTGKIIFEKTLNITFENTKDFRVYQSGVRGEVMISCARDEFEFEITGFMAVPYTGKGDLKNERN